MFIIQKLVYGFKYYYRHDDHSWQGLKDNGTKFKEKSTADSFYNSFKDKYDMSIIDQSK